LSPSAAPTRPDLHNVTSTHRPFALDAKQRRAKIQDQVVTLVAEGHEDTEPKPHRLDCDRLLREHTFLIRRQHRQQR
jgi:hypothetical protein